MDFLKKGLEALGSVPAKIALLNTPKDPFEVFELSNSVVETYGSRSLRIFFIAYHFCDVRFLFSFQTVATSDTFKLCTEGKRFYCILPHPNKAQQWFW